MTRTECPARVHVHVGKCARSGGSDAGGQLWRISNVVAPLPALTANSADCSIRIAYPVAKEYH
jgi:hypothetical protein